MTKADLRARIFGRMAISHLLGLWVMGVVGSIKTTAGIDFTGSPAVAFGGMLSIPWVGIIAIVAWRNPVWINGHPILFALTSLAFVCVTHALTLGGFIEAVAVSGATSAIIYVLLAWISSRYRSPAATTA